MQVGDADTATGLPTFTEGRAYTADRVVADFALPPAALSRAWSRAYVVRHDQRRGRRDLQARTHLDAGSLQLFDLLLQRGPARITTPLPIRAQRIGAQDAGQDQVQHRLRAR